MEELVTFFGDNPVNWIKWGVVLITFALSFYILIFKVYAKIDRFFSVDRKIEKAAAMNHIIKGKLIDGYMSTSDNDDNHSRTRKYHGKYEYQCNGKRRIYWVTFAGTLNAPDTISLYYIKNPKRPFCKEEREGHTWIGLLYMIFIFSAFIIAGYVGVFLGIIDPSANL